MRDFQGRRRARRFIFSKIIIAILALLVLFLSKAVWGVYAKNRLASSGRTQAEQEFAELQAQKKELAAKVRWLASERGQEEEIRKNYAVLKPGEKVITIVDDDATTTPARQTAGQAGWWPAAIDALGGLFE